MAAKILIVEDEAIMALDLQHRLTVLGYEVPRIAASHDRALMAVKEFNPDVVLMDINIAGNKDGIETAKKIQAPVIYLTAYSEEKTLERARATRPYGYLLKPFSERELHATIQMALERNRYDHGVQKRSEQLTLAYAAMEQRKRELEQTAADLYFEKQQLEVTLNSIGDGVITTDKYGSVTYLNPIAEQKTGWLLGEAFGQSISRIFVLQNPETHESVATSIEQVLFSGKDAACSERCNLICRTGNIYSIEDCTAPLHDLEHKLTGAVLVFHDVTDARRRADEMTFAATHDALTGLVNRNEFDRRVQKAIDQTNKSGQQHALAYLDLDQFKVVNDTCGHTAADELLRQITGLLRLVLRATDTLARIGGDEFGVLLESCPPYFALQIAENLKNIIGDFHFVWDEKIFPIGVSIGLVNFGGNEPQQYSCVDLLRIADSACYMAKDQGRNRIHVYQPDDDAMVRQLGEIDWFTKISNALDEQRLVLYAQKIIALAGTQSYQQHVELLLRMIAKDGTVIPPMAFIPTAERYGLMPKIDRWVIQTAINYIAGHESGGAALFSVNLSAATLNDKSALKFILDQLVSSAIRTESICFEITETAAITNLLNARAFINGLRSKGCKFALDDFGSGMSSFSYLKHLPVDFIKIDGNIVRDVVTDPTDAAMVAAINNIGHVMGMKTIAEFAEDGAILEKLREIGIDYAQGNGVGRPEPILTNTYLH